MPPANDLAIVSQLAITALVVGSIACTVGLGTFVLTILHLFTHDR